MIKTAIRKKPFIADFEFFVFRSGVVEIADLLGYGLILKRRNFCIYTVEDETTTLSNCTELPRNVA
jgi:hypothetical protein